MKHGSLFSGIGGFDLAAEWMGWENVFHCEWNEFGQKVLKYYWPKAISYNDITKTDFTIHRGTIDVLTGGFPCQPYSLAGKRKGKEDARHLWPEMLRAIREIQPKYIVGENVVGLTNWNGGLVFNEVQTEMEAQGYEVQPFILPACGVNAPHRRERIWFIAHSNSCGNNRTEGSENCIREQSDKEQSGNRGAMQVDRFGNERLVADSRCYGIWKDKSAIIRDRNRNCTQQIQGKPNFAGGIGTADELYNWQYWPTQSPVCNGDDGISSRLDGITFPKWRNESIKAGGNAIVPQVALQIFKTIEQYEILTNPILTK